MNPTPASDVDQKPRILIVDDDPASARLAGRVAKFGGFEVQECHGAREALRLACAWRPDLVVADVRMPGIDGPELCVLLKACPSTKHLPILLISADPDFDQQGLGRFCGSRDFLVKPYAPHQLLRALNLILGRVAA